MHTAWTIVIGGLLAVSAAAHPGQAAATAEDFVIKPYLQMGPTNPGAGPSSLRVQWASPSQSVDWAVQTRSPGGEWSEAAAASNRQIQIGPVPTHWMYAAATDPVPAGERFEYRVTKSGRVCFEASARVLNTDPAKLHAVIFGDCGAGTTAQREIAALAGTLDPDLVIIPGDVVYSRGRLSEYLTRFFPVYNADQRSVETGAPMLRSSLFIAAAGNHDLSNANVDKYPDAMAFYWLWSMPRNGPQLEGANRPVLSGDAGAIAAVLDAAGSAFPNATNYSFDSGNIHWTVLDSNTYVHWDDASLRAWVASDLKAAASATWRFVVFHHPPFHASDAHKDAQWMRLISPILEEGKVDLVIGGHVHNYQRSKPLRFLPAAESKWPRDGDGLTASSPIGGTFTFDEEFDGKSATKPRGIIYLVSGAGGADLYEDKVPSSPGTWPSFTASYTNTRHSLTVLDVDGTTATIRQLDASGTELDRVVVTK
jgi:3',5'-cyclic AMP phosphodiesterase CpdA